MPIIVPDGLPVAETLQRSDGIRVMQHSSAQHQDMRPQEYAILNLMPTQVKERTERQLARLLGQTSLQVNLTLLHTQSPRSEQSDDHLAAFYQPWGQVKEKQYDGLIVTGAPIGHLNWNKVTYWDELRRIIDWSRKNVMTRIFICWGAQAALHHLYDHEKKPLTEKAFGVFPHILNSGKHPLVSQFDDEFFVPVSRHTEIPMEELVANDHLQILSSSIQTGANLVADRNGRDIFMFNHPEYGKSSLGYEYKRDVAAGKKINIPQNYFQNDDPTQPAVNRWRAHAAILYSNIIDQTYQRTVFNLQEIASLPDAIPYVESREQS